MSVINTQGVIINKGLTIAQFNEKVGDGTITSSQIASQIFDLSDDLPVSQAEKTSWNGKSNFSGAYADLTGKPTIPTSVSQLNNDSGYLTTETDPTVPSWAKAANKPTYTANEVGALASSIKGTANGVAELDSNGKVPSNQLPSYVDDVLEYATQSVFPATGESGKIYIDKATNVTYRWSGSGYVEISSSLALGETSSTAYRGDRGKIAYDHSQLAHAPNNAEENVITGIKKNGTAISPVNKIVDISVPTKISDLQNDSNYVTDPNYTHTDSCFTAAEKTKLSEIEAAAEVNIIETVKVNGTSLTPSNKTVDISVPTAITRIWS